MYALVSLHHLPSLAGPTPNRKQPANEPYEQYTLDDYEGLAVSRIYQHHLFIHVALGLKKTIFDDGRTSSEKHHEPRASGLYLDAPQSPARVAQSEHAAPHLPAISH